MSGQKRTKADLILYFDGLCEPRNPGGWGCYGWLLKRGEVTVASGRGLAARPGPRSTSNLAEYSALLAGLRGLAELDLDGQTVEVRGDSQLVINQVTGRWRCNAPHLLALLTLVGELAKGQPGLTFRWIPREQNTEADGLSRQAYQEAAYSGLSETDRQWVLGA